MEDINKLPAIDEKTISNKIKDSIQAKSSDLFLWIQKEEGKIITKAIAFLVNFVAFIDSIKARDSQFVELIMIGLKR